MKVTVKGVINGLSFAALFAALSIAACNKSNAQGYSGAAVQIPATMIKGVGVERQANLCEMGYRRALRGDTPEQVTKDLKHMPRTEFNAVAWCYNQGVNK